MLFTYSSPQVRVLYPPVLVSFAEASILAGTGHVNDNYRLNGKLTLFS